MNPLPVAESPKTNIINKMTAIVFYSEKSVTSQHWIGFQMDLGSIDIMLKNAAHKLFIFLLVLFMFSNMFSKHSAAPQL